MTRAVVRMRSIVLATLIFGVATTAPAQERRDQTQQRPAPRTIDAGMSRDQVVERLGKPKGERTAGDYTYLFYGNDCLKRCGMDDVVTLQNDAVVDAIFRSAARRYSGTSSSPRALDAAAARGTRARQTSGAVGAITTSDSAAASAAGAGHGGIVMAGAPRTDSVASAPQRRRRGRSTPAGSRRARPAARPTVPPIRLSAGDSAAAAPAPRPDAGGVDSLRTGRRTTTGPVDAGAAVQNAGRRLYPSSTPVRPSGGPGADSAVGSSAGRVPFQGSKLAPADSAAVVNRRPAPATPPKSDSTRPPARPPARQR